MDKCTRNLLNYGHSTEKSFQKQIISVLIKVKSFLFLNYIFKENQTIKGC